MQNENRVRYALMNHMGNLSNTLRKISRDVGDNAKGTEIYKVQVEFAYLQNEITSGPTYIAPKHAQDAEDLIRDLEKRVSSGALTRETNVPAMAKKFEAASAGKKTYRR